MNTNNLIYLIENPELISKKDNEILEDITYDYPFFSISHILLAKGLLNTGNIKYNLKLKKAALYSSERKKLFKLISQNISERNIENETDKSTILNPGRPLEFNENEEHSFSEWLSITKIQKIDREGESKHTDLVDEFIKQDHHIKPDKNKFFSPSETAKSSLLENDELVTETLARVYLEQGHFEKAIESYKKLSLKYPKKSGFFADQINLINNLKKK